MYSVIHAYGLSLTFSLHESLEETLPAARLWLDLVHAIKVEIGYGTVLGITSHIDYLKPERNEKQTLRRLSL